jgi:hypothetical protein
MSQLLKIYIDSNRDGQVTNSEFGQSNWIWGQDQPGAILMANKDRDINELSPEPGTNTELSKVIVEPVPAGYACHIKPRVVLFNQREMIE